MKTNLFELIVLVNKRSINKYSTQDTIKTEGYQAREQKTYVEGRTGSEFELKLVNHSDGRVLMIPSVDGLSVIDGKPADKNSKGYIVDAHSDIVIPGWTLNNDTVAKFIFADKKKSYAAIHPETPTEVNVGVIGLMVWSEKENNYKKIMDQIEEMNKHKPIYIPQPWIVPSPYPVYPEKRWDDWGWWKPYPLRYDSYTVTCGSGIGGMSPTNIVRSGSMNCSNTIQDATAMTLTAATDFSIENTSLSPTEDMHELGTGFGKESEFKTVEQTFEKDAIVATIALYYDSRKNLEKLGIIISKSKKEIKQSPNPFPGLTGCKPPVDWKV